MGMNPDQIQSMPDQLKPWYIGAMIVWLCLAIPTIIFAAIACLRLLSHKP